MTKRKAMIITALVLSVIFMGIGFAALSSSIAINGTAKVSSVWDVAITNVEMVENYGLNPEVESPSFSGTEAYFNLDFAGMPGDYVIYEITIENRGTISAKLEEYVTDPEDLFYDSSRNVLYAIYNEPSYYLAPGETTTFAIQIMLNDQLDYIATGSRETTTIQFNYREAYGAEYEEPYE